MKATFSRMKTSLIDYKQYLSILIIVLGITYFLSPFFSSFDFPKDEFDYDSWGKLLAMSDGRLRPLDTTSRTILLLLQGKQTVKFNDYEMSATEWILDSLAKPNISDDYPVFLINNPEVKNALGIFDTDRKHYSFREMIKHIDFISEQVREISAIKANKRSAYQREMFNFYNRLTLYHRLKNSLFIQRTENNIEKLNRFQKIAAQANEIISKKRTIISGSQGKETLTEDERITMRKLDELMKESEYTAQISYIRFLPPLEGHNTEWSTYGDGLLEIVNRQSLHPHIETYAHIIDAYQHGDYVKFNNKVKELNDFYTQKFPSESFYNQLEYQFNRFDLFYKGIIVYFLSFLFICVYWMSRNDLWYRCGVALFYLTFFFHSLGIGLRMLIQGRPPVTNLYSSSIFVGWGAVAISGVLLFLLKKRSQYLVGVASLIGGITLIIALNLASAQGDTMEMMQAVLDSNFWLATHVIVITIGYSSTFLAGFLGMLYLLQGIFTKQLTPEKQRYYRKVVYGIIAFSLIFSFTGTILGGIWADQSWGRFWGWDPKENGALLLVLWCAITLHCHRFGFVQTGGLMKLAIVGNVVTLFAWFGVNLLGVGLHSYGFTDKGFSWFIGGIFFHLVFLFLGFLPTKYWRSKPPMPPKPTIT